ncbi:MAG: hypothetical protein KJO26_10930 [Deltaproteobacteria bacterium]|nr:hypothetical protein [Deltaproteobacteria bacterium]
MRSVKHSKKFSINQPIEILFPLFSAEGEKLWVPGWDYENVMGSNDLHEDDIFLTQNHDHASSKAVWLVKRYDPKAHFVQLYKVEPNDKVGIISVKCLQIGESKTEVKVTYHYISISEKGNEFIKHFTSEEYTKFINEWEKLLLRYFG